ncbi:hypothetical protein [Phenylobacterium montanum]|uniref:SLATT domain-containing protein n=1 Tax=Phenylobacterium montanum TaxID=2823693 RepID=A0A975IW97_9CAUL|nr:hypothetical protein [Caulobacter sp. S6]QUD89852.1 hypothetical protein KCG34_08275 [Caulobacter sp. S6]
MDKKAIALVDECQRQFDSCRYSAASLFIWLKYARWWRTAFLVIPIIIGGAASSQILTDFGGTIGKSAAILCGALAGFFPAIYVALNMDMNLLSISRAATEFTNLRDRFRQAALVKSAEPFEEFNAVFEQLMDRMDAIRSSAPPSPEWCFKEAQKKIGAGDYDFAVDLGIRPKAEKAPSEIPS